MPTDYALPVDLEQARRSVFRLGTRARRALIGGDLERRMERLETQLHESREETWERSRERWRATGPTANLTWGIEVSGEPFIRKAAEHGALGPDRRVLEVGPGYGRLLSAAIERGDSFRSYVGVDLSAKNVDHLRERFPRDDVTFVHADIETVDLGEPVDTLISSLVLKHLFPSFGAGLRNSARQMNAGGLAVFDLIEGQRRYFADDGVSYVRHYSRPEIQAILAAAGLELAAFDEVRHLPDHARLLVIARKPG
jgi:SAM-dependent methyltransferase